MYGNDPIPKNKKQNIIIIIKEIVCYYLTQFKI